jgi:cysteine-rich repeat protein
VRRDELSDACRTDCTLPSCGDSVVDYGQGEECDDGGTADGDGCSATCAVEVTGSCGDGVLDFDLGEECDDNNTDDGDGCSSTCQLEPVGAACGDGTQDADEECDDSNVLNYDTCNPTCNLTNTTTAFAGDQGTAGLLDGIGSAAQVGGYGALASDNDYVWFADGGNNVLRRIEIATAAVLTVAGDYPGGNSGDVDGDGLAARFAGLESIATDGTTIWVGDGGNRKIKSITAGAPFTVTTLAGNGTQACTDGVGNLAEFDDLRGLTYYNGYVYLLDGSCALLRRFDPTTNQVDTLAGQAYVTTGLDGYGLAATFNSPRYMASDNSGTLYIADTNGNKIRYYNTVTDYLGTFAGDGTSGYVDGIGTAARIHRPRGMTSDGTSIYFAEFNQHTIRQGVLGTYDVSTNCGQHCDGASPCNGGYTEGQAAAAEFDGPFGITFHYLSNSLFVLDGGNNLIRRIQ